MKEDPKHDRKREMGHYSSGYSDNYEPLEALDLSKVRTTDDLVRGMKKCAFGARNVGEAADVLETMVRDKDCYKVLTLSGAMTVAKMGLVVCDMIDRGMIDAVISTGALMAHGFVESVGMRHFKYTWDMKDEELYEKGYDRVYDTLELEKNLDDVSEIMDKTLDSVPENEVLCSHKIHRMLGEYLAKNTKGRGVLRSAFEKKVPVYVPAYTDSELGLDFALHNRKLALAKKPQLQFNPFLDLEDFTGRVKAAKKIGIFTIGGGVPRNWAQQAACYLDLINNRVGQGGDFKRYSYAVRICPEPVHWGGMCLHGDTKIEMPRDLSKNMEGIPIKELVGKANFPIYSYDIDRKRMVVSNVRQVIASGRKKLYRINFGWIAGWNSNKKELKTGSIIASADHKFLLKDGSYRRVSELQENDRLMPFNSYYKADVHGEYRILSLNNGKKIPEHRLVAEHMLGRALSLSEIAHHIDHNTINNNPDNLIVTNFAEHSKYHRYNDKEEVWQKRANTQKIICNSTAMQQKSRKYWNNLSEGDYLDLCIRRREIALKPEERVRRSQVSSEYWEKMDIEEKRARLQNAHKATRERWANMTKEQMKSYFMNERNTRWIKGITEDMIKDALIKEHGIITKAAGQTKISVKVFTKRMKEYGVTKEWVAENCVDNHFVMSIEYFGEEDTFDITVDDTHNFAANGIVVSNSGCSYSEGVSWGKIVPKSEGGKYVEVFDDATIAWPLIVKAVMERLDKKLV